MGNPTTHAAMNISINYLTRMEQLNPTAQPAFESNPISAF
jgi:hypothetical protein